MKNGREEPALEPGQTFDVINVTARRPVNSEFNGSDLYLILIRQETLPYLYSPVDVVDKTLSGYFTSADGTTHLHVLDAPFEIRKSADLGNYSAALAHSLQHLTWYVHPYELE